MGTPTTGRKSHTIIMTYLAGAADKAKILVVLAPLTGIFEFRISPGNGSVSTYRKNYGSKYIDFFEEKQVISLGRH